MRPSIFIVSTILFSTTLAFAAGNSPKSQELHLRFEAIPGPVPQTVEDALHRWPRPISEQRRLMKAEPAPRPPRSEELGPDHLRIEAYDARGSRRYFQDIPDPRIIRAEFPPAGQTTGEVQPHVIITDAADFVMPLPTDEPGRPPIVELRIYQRSRQGEPYELELIGTHRVK